MAIGYKNQYADYEIAQKIARYGPYAWESETSFTVEISRKVLDWLNVFQAISWHYNLDEFRANIEDFFF